MRHLAIVIAVLGAAACSDSSPTMPTPPTNIAGNWSGTFETSNQGTHPFTMSVAQADQAVNGSWSTDNGWEGNFSGTISQSSISGTMDVTIPTLTGTCAGQATLGGTVFASTVNWTLGPFSGTCGSYPENVRVNAQKR